MANNNNKKKRYHQTKTIGPDGRIVSTVVEDETPAVVEEPEKVEEEQDTCSEAPEKESVDTDESVYDAMDKVIKDNAPHHAEKAVPPTYEHMYRVRLEWDKPDTQIFASPDFEAAKNEALKHDGYKVFEDDEGTLKCDPWLELRNKPVETNNEETPVRHPIPGKAVELVNEPLYRTGLDHVPFMNITATVYYYDNEIVNGKAKVTAMQHDFTKELKTPNLILGYIKV